MAPLFFIGNDASPIVPVMIFMPAKIAYVKQWIFCFLVFFSHISASSPDFFVSSAALSGAR